MKARTTFLIAVLALFFLLTASSLFYLQTQEFQELVRNAVVSQIESKTGLECRLERLELNLLRGILQIDGFELSAPESGGGLSSIKMDQIRARFNLSSLWHFQMRLAELHLVNPQVDLFTAEDKDKEASAWDPEKILRTLDISLSLETEQFTVTNGRIRINEQSAPFNVSLKDLICRIGYQDEPLGYKIFLSYKDSRFYYKERDIVHDLKVEMDLSLTGIAIETLEFDFGESRLHGSGTMPSWDSPELLIHLSGPVTSEHLVLANSSLDKGSGSVDVRIDLRYDADGIYLDGDFFARRGEYNGMDYTDMSGDLEILHDVLHLRNVKGKIGGGDFTAEGDIQLKSSNNKPHAVSIHSEKVPLFEIGDLLDSPKLRYQNVADAETRIAWGYGRNTDLHCEAYLYGVESPSAEGLLSTPLEGEVFFRYYGGGILEFSKLDLRSVHTRLNALGGKDSLYHFDVSTSRLAEPFGLIANFSPAVARLLNQHPDLKTVGGNFDISGDATIRSSSDIEFEGGISGKAGNWRSIIVDAMDSKVAFKGSSLEFNRFSLMGGNQSVKGDLSIVFGEEGSLAGFGFKGNFQKIAMSILEDLDLAVMDMTGVLSGEGQIGFREDAWSGDGRISVESGSLLGESFDRLESGIAFSEQSIRFRDIRLFRGEARLDADGRIDTGTRRLDFTVRLDRLPLESIPGLMEKNTPLRGYANASGSIGGTWDKPEFESAFDLSGLYYDSWSMGDGNGRLQLREDILEGSLDIHPEYGDLSMNARISIAQGYAGKMTLDFKKFNIQKLVAGKSIPFLDIDRTVLNGILEGTGFFNEWDSVEFKGKMDGVLFGINDYELQNAGEIEFSILNRKLEFENAKIIGEGTDMSLTGDLSLDASELDMDLNGDLNLRILSGMQEKLSTSGDAFIDLHVTGSKENPEIIGRLELKDGVLNYSDIPFPVSKIKGNVLFSENVIRLEGITGEAASGSFVLSGSYEHSKMVMQSINMAINISNARLPYPTDFNSLVDATLNLNGDRDLQILEGTVDVIRSEYIRDFNLLERFAEQGGKASGWLASAPSLQNLRLNIEFRSNNGLVIDNDLARVRGSLRLTLRGTPAYPSLTGRIESGDGTIFFRRNRFEISHAYADFIDRNRINPVLEIRAEADVKSTVDIISLLTTGMAETGNVTSERESQMAGMSAASVLSENLTGVIGKRVQRIFGLESFRVDPFLADAGNEPTARITISERISPDIVLTFSRNLSTNEEQIVVIEYYIGKNLSVTAIRDEDGEFGVDFRLRKRFR
ncbi:MAG: translocation/assembly module TamB domain-containing protein [Acidobacteriota bacterium]